MYKTIFLLFAAVQLSSCATQRFSDVDADKELYRVAGSGGWSTESGGQVKADLYQKAGEFCRERGLNCLPLQDSYSDKKGLKRAHAELQFRCVTDDNQELVRPVFWPKAPDSGND